MKKLIYILTIVLLAAGCKKETAVPPPGRTRLIFPERDALCTTGNVISNTESKVIFKWSIAKDADNYDLVIKNLLTGTVVTYQSNNTSYETVLLRATPYAWHINSRSIRTPAITASDTLKFYNAGAASVNYAPYPADFVAPLLGQVVPFGNGKIILDWNGADVDNDITNYDVYFGTSQTPPAIKLTLKDSKLEDVVVIAGTTYYWKVITHDAAGNTSDSGIIPFFVN